MKFEEFLKLLRDNNMISDDWRNLLKLLSGEISDNNKDEVLKLFSLYFSLIEDGNVYMSLNKEILMQKFATKIEKQKALSEESGESNTSLDILSAEINKTVDFVDKITDCSVIGKTKLFIIDNTRLFARKYYNALMSIKKSVERLFVKNEIIDHNFDYKKAVGDFTLTDKQEEVVKKGFDNNLLVTGGPGCGKTSSIFFLLLGILQENIDYEVYLTAPSGKAASRMKESISESIPHICVEYKNDEKNNRILQKIDDAKEYTIHRLLGCNYDTGGFNYNKNNLFPVNSIFIIDEASMLDICLFASLLDSIPTGAKVFILGDKNQLPSVECGAVFGDLLKVLDIQNIVELNESKRFTEDSDIYKLAERINNGEELPLSEDDFKSVNDFEICENTEGYNIFYYNDNGDGNKDFISTIADKWYKKYYSELQKICINLSESDYETFKSIMKITDNARILCASNQGSRGTVEINRKILKSKFPTEARINGSYPGEILMVTNNNKSLDLYNGDCGVAVKFKNDDSLYVMFQTSNRLNIDDGKRENKIFKLGEFIFYPIRLIETKDIVPAFAITIHKSQGSAYKNILVILPKIKGHPLLNRQIVYTAITRTKGNTYIISNKENLEYSRDTVLTRDTGF